MTEAVARTATAGVFHDTLADIAEELTEQRTEHYYAASIALRIARLEFTVRHLMDPDPPRFPLELKDFLLTPDADPDEAVEPPEETEDERRERVSRTRAAWLGAAGLNTDGSVRTQLPPGHRGKNRGGKK